MCNLNLKFNKKIMLINEIDKSGRNGPVIKVIGNKINNTSLNFNFGIVIIFQNNNGMI